MVRATNGFWLFLPECMQQRERALKYDSHFITWYILSAYIVICLVYFRTVSAVSDDVDNINDSLESLKELLAGGAGINIDPGSLLGFQLDKDTLHGVSFNWNLLLFSGLLFGI